MKEFRTESDLLGELQVPKEAYYGVQTQRALENFHISTSKMNDYPEFIRAFAFVKLPIIIYKPPIKSTIAKQINGRYIGL